MNFKISLSQTIKDKTEISKKRNKVNNKKLIDALIKYSALDELFS